MLLTVQLTAKQAALQDLYIMILFRSAARASYQDNLSAYNEENTVEFPSITRQGASFSEIKMGRDSTLFR